MAPTWGLLRESRPARIFFLAHAQSALGTGAAYVGLMLLAYDRMPSEWAISLVLLADLMPAMLLGPVLGAAVDRWSRRWCAVAADLTRALAFVLIAVVDDFGATIALAALAGFGTGLFSPAVLAGLPSLVGVSRLPAGTAMYGLIADLGFTLGPALAAVALAIASPEAMMLVNGLSFLVSALAIGFLPFGRAPVWDRRERRRSLVAEAREGVRLTMAMALVRRVIIGSSAVILFAGLFNVAEFFLATEELGAGDAGFAILVGIFGLGVAAGSLSGARGGRVAELKDRYLLGLFLTGAGFLAAAAAPVYALAALAFAVAGAGNGLVLVNERLLLQTTVRDELLGRVFGLKDLGTSWGFAIAFVAAGALLSIAGTRLVILVAGIGGMLVFAWTVWAFRGDKAEPEEGAPALDELVADPLSIAALPRSKPIAPSP